MRPYAVRPVDEWVTDGDPPERLAVYDQQCAGPGPRDYSTGIVSIAYEKCTSRDANAEPIQGGCETIDLSEDDVIWLLATLSQLMKKRREAERLLAAKKRAGKQAERLQLQRMGREGMSPSTTPSKDGAP